MKNLLNKISDSEKERILEMHRNAIRKNVLIEQGTPTSGLGSTAAGSQTTTPTQTSTTNQTATQTQSDVPSTIAKARKFGDSNYLLQDITTQDKLNSFKNVSVNDITFLNKVPFTDKTEAAKKNPKLTDTIMTKYVIPGLTAMLDIHAQLGVTKPYRTIGDLQEAIQKSTNISPNSTKQSALDLILVAKNKGKDNDLFSQYKALLNSRVAALKTPTQTGQ